MKWTKVAVSCLLTLAATFRPGVILAADTAGQSAGKNRVLSSQYEYERQEKLKIDIKSLEYNSQLATERAQRPHNPRIIECYLGALDAEIKGDVKTQLALLEEAYKLSIPEKGNSLWEVLRYDFSFIAENLFYLVDRLDDYDYEEKLAKYDHFSRYQPSDDDIQAYLLGVMLERMSYDAVLEYCARRITEGHDVYRVLRVELRLLMQRETIDRELLEHYKKEVRSALKRAAVGADEPTEASIKEKALQQFYTNYDPTMVEPRQAKIMFDEIESDPTRNVARLKRYCTLLRVSYEMTHANKEAVLSYYAYAAEVIGAPHAEFSPFRTSQEIETERNEALAHIRTCEAEVEKRFEDYARDRDAGKFGETYKYKSEVFDFNLDKRWEREEALKEKAEEVSYLGLDDVFPR